MSAAHPVFHAFGDYVQLGLATYPDVSVVSGPRELDPEDKNSVTNPTLLVEVTSKSTEEYDRTEKFDHYRAIPSLREYVLVSHGSRRSKSGGATTVARGPATCSAQANGRG